MDDATEPGDSQLDRALEDIAAGTGQSSQHLASLSHLLPADVSRFRQVWEPLTDRQKLALLDALSRDEAESLRLDYNAIYHIGMEDPSRDVRLRSVQSTIEDDSAWLLDRLLRLLSEEQETDIRAAAALALQPFAQRAELGELDAEDTARVRAALLDTYRRGGERIDVRAEALAAVGYFSDAEVQHELEEAFRDEALRLHALRGMGHSADPAWLRIVLPMLEDSDESLRRAAAQAAGEIGDEAAVPVLVDLIDDRAQAVRLAAIAALGEIGGEESREALLYALEDPDEAIRQAAETAVEGLDFFEDPLAP
jgi:HEAT repeat protein